MQNPASPREPRALARTRPPLLDGPKPRERQHAQQRAACDVLGRQRPPAAAVDAHVAIVAPNKVGGARHADRVEAALAAKLVALRSAASCSPPYSSPMANIKKMDPASRAVAKAEAHFEDRSGGYGSHGARDYGPPNGYDSRGDRSSYDGRSDRGGYEDGECDSRAPRRERSRSR